MQISPTPTLPAAYESKNHEKSNFLLACIILMRSFSTRFSTVFGFNRATKKIIDLREFRDKLGKKSVFDVQGMAHGFANSACLASCRGPDCKVPFTARSCTSTIVDTDTKGPYVLTEKALAPSAHSFAPTIPTHPLRDRTSWYGLVTTSLRGD